MSHELTSSSSEVLDETRNRLLQAAGEVFAEMGFRGATNRDICARAGANVAAINYHFGSKEQLYREVMAYSFAQGVEKYPLLPDPGESAEVQFGKFIAVTLERMLDEGKPAWHGALMVREMAEPTAAMDHVAERFMKPHFAVLLRLVRGLVGERVPEARVRLMGVSVMGQCVFLKMGRPALERVVPELRTGPAERVELARHITQVVVAACRAVRAEFESADGDEAKA